MPTSLTLETSHGYDGELVLKATGEIDLSNIDAFDRALTKAATEAAGGDRKLTVDLSAVEYLDSAAVNALFSHADHIHLIAHPLLMSILSMCGLTELITTEPAPTGH
ncbi:MULTISPECIES: STAS domain-containing protein [unclassified Mycobacterium]|uniref:STAS domain-containing protein n=1 Tax=unclassified Mycobacterium TaxID=2642494 RepID=UPI000F99005B|nr:MULTISPECIES: STAS domain-containing protein [unclassified Mycobacterium]MDP7701154.1 STAS domain-containing protein [Mycobacterium sp. TY815]MDP7724017.1 STAS domain-containing protein [Mycobacterium sp. TY814]RUP05025.1 MAG: anti-sigma factor antagonist [Mycobacterium sp.]